MRAAVCLVVALSLISPPTLADEPLPAIPPGPDKITPLQKGDLAPYAGQLYDNPTSIRWANWLWMYKQRREMDQKAQETICRADIDLRDKKLALERDKYNKVVADLEKRLKDAEDPPFYRTAEFGFGVGVVGTVVVVVAAAALVNAVTTE